MNINLAISVSENADISEPVLFRKDYFEALKFAKFIGADGIEIHVKDPSLVDGSALAEASKKECIKIAVIATVLAYRIDGLSLIDDDESMRKKAIERLKGHIDLAQDLKCPIVIGSIRSNIPQGQSKDRYYKFLKEGLEELSSYISDSSCFLMLEAITKSMNNYLNTAEETVNFIKTINSDKIKLLLDIYHMAIEEKNILESIEKYSKYVGYVHICQENRMYPGNGSVDIKSVIDCLKINGYSGWLVMECLPIPSEKEAAYNGIKFMRDNL